MSLHQVDLDKFARSQLSLAGKLGHIDKDFIEILSYPKHEVTVNFPVRLTNKKLKIFKGFRIQHCNLHGPYKGGIRFHQEVNQDECKALAFWMTIKCSLLQLPLGGAKGGVQCNPLEYSQSDLKLISKSFSKAMFKYIGSQRDIPAPDLGTNSQTMDWMTAAAQEVCKTHDRAIYTGKSLSYGGSEGREEATGRGIMICVREWFTEKGISTQGKTFIVQGFGKVGSFASKLLVQELGMQCIAVGDHTGYYCSSNQNQELSIEELITYAKTNLNLSGSSLLSEISRDNFFSYKTDLLVPAAMEMQITKHEATLIQAKLIVEGANGPTDLEADKILFDKNIDIIPDVLANAGGVVVSYFEWLQNKRQEYWELEEVRSLLEKKMINAYNKVRTYSKDNNINRRMSSYILAIRNLEYVYLTQSNDTN